MKKLILSIAFLTILFCNAQDKEYSNIIKVISATGAYDDGYNFGIQYEHTNNTIYVGTEFYASPKLNHSKQPEPLSYYHLIGRFGLNHYFNYGVNEIIRIYSSGRAGFILRDGSENYHLLGLEAGFEFILWDTLLLGASVTSDMKTDSKLYSRNDNHVVNSVFVSIGYRF